jgi:NAD-reducing hydrogenase small subunit
LELGDDSRQLPHAPGIVPELLDEVRPVHEVVNVDLYLPGCPPSAERIQSAIAPLLEAKNPDISGREMLKFG